MSHLASTTDTCGPRCQGTVHSARFVVTREMDLGGDHYIGGFDADEQRNDGEGGWPGCHYDSKCADCVVRGTGIDLDRLLELAVAKPWMEGSLRPFGIRIENEREDCTPDGATWYVRVR